MRAHTKFITTHSHANVEQQCVYIEKKDNSNETTEAKKKQSNAL